MPDAGSPLSVHFAELTREEARELGPRGLVVVPFGATEQHGPHLPLGTDTLHLSHIAVAAAERAARSVPIAVAPALPYGSSDHHLPFGGTMSLSNATLTQVALELGRSLVTGGCRRLFFLNGHGGNVDVLRTAARDLALECPVDVAVASWWDTAATELSVAGLEMDARVPGHAGAFETAVGLAVHPRLVRARPADRATLVPGATAAGAAVAPPYRVERHGAWGEFDGYTDYPLHATEEHGRHYVGVAIARLAAAFVAFGGRPIS
jgi:creatinine amidohydrolase